MRGLLTMNYRKQSLKMKQLIQLSSVKSKGLTQPSFFIFAAL